MPSIRKLADEEVQRSAKRGESQRARIAREYDGYLEDFAVNEYGEVVLDEDESKLTVRNRLKAAAHRKGWTLAFLRTPGPVIRFQVRDHAEPVVNNGIETSVNAEENAEDTLDVEPARSTTRRHRRKETA